MTFAIKVAGISILTLVLAWMATMSAALAQTPSPTMTPTPSPTMSPTTTVTPDGPPATGLGGS